MNVIFDFDGVIVNSHRIKTLAFYNIFKKYGINTAKKAKKFHLENIGKSRYFKFKYILKNKFPKKRVKGEIENLDNNFDFFVEKKLKKLKPSKHLIKFLKHNSNSTHKFISSGTPQKKIIKILKEKKLFKYFDKVYGSPSTKVDHINQIKKNNKKCIFIGDSIEDYKAAKFTNIDFLLKINSENFYFRKKQNLKTLSSFKFLKNKI